MSKKPVTKSTAVVPKAAADLARLTEEEQAIMADAGVGTEHFRDIPPIVPRLTILQPLSPQVLKNNSRYIKGAEAGDFCDVSIGTIYKEEMEIIPVFFALMYLEWAPRSSGKGLIKNHGMDRTAYAACEVDEKGKHVTANGNYIQDTATFFVLNVTDGFRPSFIPLTSTNMRSAKELIALIDAQRHTINGKEVKPAIFYRAYKATPVERSNADGTWHVWHFEPSRRTFEISPEIWQACKDFNEMAKGGIVQGDTSDMGGDEDNNSNGAM